MTGLVNNFHITDMSYAQLHTEEHMTCVYVSCTRQITHKLHMHILQGKSLEPKEMHLILRHTNMDSTHFMIKLGV